MKADCHIHMVLDGENWRSAIDTHRISPDREIIRSRLKAYAAEGVTYLRDGGDKWGVGAAAREMAAEYGITYRTPLAPLCKTGHYGGFLGERFGNFREFRSLVEQHRQNGADFIKIMISGIMDFDRFGVLTEEGLPGEEIRELIHISHEEGFPAMLHANGARVVEAAAAVGADSVEHGAYLSREAMAAMKEAGTVWCPTLSPIGNLMGKGRFGEGAVRKIYDSAISNVAAFAKMGGLIAPGSDAGAWAVPHAAGIRTEYAHLKKALGTEAESVLVRGISAIQTKF